MAEGLLTVMDSADSRKKAPAGTRGRSKNDMPLSAEQLKTVYRTMVRTRALDERGISLQRQGRIGFYIGCAGQEAAHIGSAFALRPDDWIFAAYREPGAALLRGLSAKTLLDQCFGNGEDPCKGRQMPCHYAFKNIQYASISSPIGTQCIEATGVAMAMRIRKKDGVSISYFGDGATSSNDFHSGCNFAAVFKAPTIFFCQNNGWAISLPTHKQTASESIAAKAAAYGMPGVRVDGNDVLAVYQATREAAERARTGNGPTLIEAVTYRMGPHSTSDDPTRYRSDEELKCWKDKDPIERLRHYMEAHIDWDQASEDALWEEARAEVASAAQAAERLSAPSINSIFDDVYAQLPWHLREQRAELVRIHPPAPMKQESDDYKFP